MNFPGEKDLLIERAAFVETLETLTDDEFCSGPTLCEGWAPRDVLGHLLGVDFRIDRYITSFGNITKANAKLAAEAHQQSRERLMRRAHHWAGRPAPHVRVLAFPLLGDLATHHQDVVRGLGRTRPLPDATSAAILREGMVLGATKLAKHRIEPTDGGPKVGFGPTVRGTREALGLWLSGRRGIEPDLVFST